MKNSTNNQDQYLSKGQINKVNYFNVRIDLTVTREVINKCIEYFGSKSTHTIFFLNAHCFNVAQKNEKYLKAINSSDMLLNDGVGIKIGSVIAGIKIRENLNGTDLIPKVLELTANTGRKVFFLGGKPGIANKAAKKAKETIPGIQIAGFESGFFTPGDNAALVNKINESGAELLLLAMGVPKQELWATANKESLTNVRIILAGGAILDFISGTIKRAPGWLRKINMEWIYRLYLEPKRMWKRYIIGNLLFFYYILNQFFSRNK